jgi:hypothetical protein
MMVTLSVSSRFQLLQSQSQTVLYDWRFTTNKFVLATSPLRLTTSNFSQLNACSRSPYLTPSLTRGWVCRLQLLLVFASAVILRSESSWTHDHILLSQIRDFPNTEGQVPVFISPRSRVTQLYPQALGSLFVAYNDSQGYGGGIRSRLHMGCSDPKLQFNSRYIASEQTRQKKAPPPTALIVGCVTVAAIT